MAFTFIAAASGTNSGSGSTLDCSGALNVATGDLLVAWCTHEGANTTFAVAKTTGTPANSLTFDLADEVNHAEGEPNASFGYLLSASEDATATFRFTSGAARTWRNIIVLQFRPDSGDVVTKDDSDIGQGTGTPFATGSITTTGTDEVVCGGYAPYSSDDTSSELILGSAATEPTGSPTSNHASAWYRILTGTGTGTAACTNASEDEWVMGVIAFKATAAAGRATKNARSHELGMQHGQMFRTQIGRLCA